MRAMDFRSWLLETHAQHLGLLHFPIALFRTGVAFDVAARCTKRTSLAVAAQANLVVAASFVPPVLATGILAWPWQLLGQKLRGALRLHLVLGSVWGWLMGVVGWVHIRARRNLPDYRCLLELPVALLLVLVGHLGGVLSGVNPVPKTSYVVLCAPVPPWLVSATPAPPSFAAD
jgi:uncharacterized membrane protein